MDSKQASKILERIVAIHKSLQLEAGGSLSAMERDLLLDYLRQLYDFYHAHPTGQVAAPTAPAATAPIAKPQAAPKPVVVKAPVAPPAAPVAPPQPRPAPAPAPKPVVVKAPVAPKPAPVAPPALAPKPVEVKAPPAAVPSPTVPSRTSGPMPAKVRALFAESDNNDLSEQLSRQPIKDLTKAMGINDRLLYSNDLFKGNQELMNNFLKDCNRHTDFSPAQTALGELAQQFDWTEDERADTARQFIKLVRRRYA